MNYYVVRVVQDGGIYSGEYLYVSDRNIVCVTDDINKAEHFFESSEARDFINQTQDPARLMVYKHGNKRVRTWGSI